MKLDLLSRTIADKKETKTHGVPDKTTRALNTTIILTHLMHYLMGGKVTRTHVPKARHKCKGQHCVWMATGLQFIQRLF